MDFFTNVVCVLSLLSHRLLSPTLGVSDSVDQRCDLRIFISNKFLGDTTTAVLTSIL